MAWFQNQAGDPDFAPYLALLGGGWQAGAALGTSTADAAFARANAAIAGLQGQSELQMGAEHAELYRQHLAQTVGKQTAQIGGANLVRSGSALRALETTGEFGARDVAQIQLNAARRAWGYSTSEVGDEARAAYDKSAGKMGALGSLITSGSRAFGDWSTD
jgi:hypothetical protein